jgi:hypothetical protein
VLFLAVEAAMQLTPPSSVEVKNGWNYTSNSSYLFNTQKKFYLFKNSEYYSKPTGFISWPNIDIPD